MAFIPKILTAKISNTEAKMQIRTILALSLLTSITLTGKTYADIAPKCQILPPVPVPEAKLSVKENNQQLIHITADESQAKVGEKAIFKGQVVFTQGTRTVHAERATFDQKTEDINADGNLVLQDSIYTITAESLMAQMKNNTAVLDNTKYWLHGKQIHGAAEQLEITPQNNLLLTETNLTTCPPDDASWLLEAKKIKIDSSDEWGEIWGAKLRVLDVPILYIPYLTVPVSDKRKTGLLFPSFSTSTDNGAEIVMPWYWNIAPEYDLTLTPHYMSKRGLFLKSQFRYLGGETQQGQIDVEYINSDKEQPNRPKRYLYHWQHKGKLYDNWRVSANFTQVSDDTYLYDLPSDVLGPTNQLSRVGEISYFQQNWNTSIRVQNIEVLGNVGNAPYQVMPEIKFNYYMPELVDDLYFELNTDITNFQHSDKNSTKPEATRLHLSPSLSWPIYGPAGSIISQVKLYQTNYWQKDIEKNSKLAPHASRTIPQAKIYGQINFERNASFFGEGYRQTLTPQVQYLYVGYQDQQKIGIYDTAALQDDFFGLFRDRRYSGLDRIANANQFTLGMTTRLLDETNQELYKFSIGQIIFLEKNKVPLGDLIEEAPAFSVLAAEMDAKIYQNFYFSGAAQYDTKESRYKKAQVTLDYRQSDNKLVQLSYRYVPDLLDTNTNNRINISQTGVRTEWPLTDNIHFVGDWYYDLNNNRSIEAFSGLQYESCCWGIRLSYHYHITPGTYNGSQKFDSGFYLNFMLKGLGGSNSLDLINMHDQTLFSYRKPLYAINE